jgi:hypothetical protein
MRTLHADFDFELNNLDIKKACASGCKSCPKKIESAINISFLV